VVTDAELDHTVGILLLREGRHLRVYATPAVSGILNHDSRIIPVTRAFAEVEVTEIRPGQATPLMYRTGEVSGIAVEPFRVPAGPPRFASQAADIHTVGLKLYDQVTKGTCVFVPGCGELDEAVLQQLEEADLLLFDGTFWSDDELVALDISDRTARQMDHLPVSGPEGSLARLASLSRPRKVYTHINNTNPMLLEDSPQRRAVEQAGIAVGSDGMSFTV
jgi:pyrroloquinoline quinone biosynthesis protein B